MSKDFWEKSKIKQLSSFEILSNEYWAKSKIKQLKILDYTVSKKIKILDFGCGAGALVQAFQNLGYDACGCDVTDCPSLDSAHYKKIDLNNYRLPFDDNYFDFVYSTSVFEHVFNTEESLREIYRVLKPGGITIHSLPSRYRIIEPHVKVPLGGIIHLDLWLKLWAFLGVRNEFQKGLPYKEVYLQNKRFFLNRANYMSFKQFKNIIVSVFGNAEICKWEYLKYNPGGAAKLGRMLPIPGYSYLLFFFREWHVYMRKPK